MIITEAGNHASVMSLVYINAFQPDVGETAGGLQNKTQPATTSIRRPAVGSYANMRITLMASSPCLHWRHSVP
jgi:hypothetical protein